MDKSRELERYNNNDDDSFILFIAALIIFMLVLLIIMTSRVCVRGIAPVTEQTPIPPSAPSAPPADVPSETGSFAEGAEEQSDTCAAFGGEPDLSNPGEMFDQHPLLEFCITTCPLYDDAVTRAAAEDAALADFVKADPNNSLWEMRQEYYTIYLDALHTQGERLGC